METKRQNKFSRTQKIAMAGSLLGMLLLTGTLKEGIRRITDLLFETPTEISLEEKIGKPLYFDITSHGSERDSRSGEFEEVYDSARQNWDNFDQQFDLIKRIYLISRDGPGLLGKVNQSGRLKLYNLKNDTLIHEMAHSWHFNLPQSERAEFENRWGEITGGHYVTDCENATPEDLEKNGAVRKGGLKNMLEDVAYTTSLIYQLNNPAVYKAGFPNKKPSFRKSERLDGFSSIVNISTSLEKVEAKSGLLKDYRFISEREYDHAMEELSGFRDDIHFYRDAALRWIGKSFAEVCENH